MFTGLVTDFATVERITSGAVTEVWVASSYEGDFLKGESIACDGVCLTVVEFQGSRFMVQAAPETLRRTTLGNWVPGTRINLERALRLGDRLGGHWVQGHVDGISTVVDVRPEGGSRLMRFSLSTALVPFVVEKGSVCLDGVSLTVTDVGSEHFSVMLIPETQQHTSLGQKQIGQRVNVETDIIGKYVARMMNGRAGTLSTEQLKAAGFL